MGPVLELRGISKRFPGVVANDRIDFTLMEGEIHSLLGENGAGKTTLMNILYGLYTPDEGSVVVDGREVSIRSPSDALGCGIGMVHQHFMLIPVMTVAENIILGKESKRGGLLDMSSAKQRIRELASRYRFDIDPDDVVKDLPIGAQQRVEIVKALYREARILILDEPTAVLTPQETDELFAVLRSLRGEGKSIIFISHKLKEVLEISDNVTVLRNGRVVGSVHPGETDEQRLARMMVGREVLLKVQKGPMRRGSPVLEVKGLTVHDARGVKAVDGVDFVVHRGEVFGLAGVQGNGQTELVQALTGLLPFQEGSVFVQGVPAGGRDPREIIKLGAAHIPEDRQKYGLVLPYPVRDNLILCSYYEPPYSKKGVFDFGAISKTASALVAEFDIKTPGITALTETLSGGNQQKTVVARELSRNVALLIASQPTRGLDVGSIEYIHRKIIETRDAGCGVLLVSSELDEIMGLSDTIGVMFKGRLIAVMNAEQATKEGLGLLMAGIRS